MWRRMSKETEDDKKYPVCDGCGDEIISIPEVSEPRFRLRIRHPSAMGLDPPEFDAGAFCLGCVVEMSRFGLRIWPRKDAKGEPHE